MKKNNNKKIPAKKPGKKENKKDLQSKPLARKQAQKGTKKTSSVPVGRTVMVRNGHINKGAKKPNEKRTHVVIETNKEDLALVRLTSKKPNTTQLKNYQDGSSYFKHFVEIEDVKGNPLRVGEDITQNHQNMDLSIKKVNYIKKILNSSKEKEKYLTDISNFRNRYKNKQKK